MSNPLFSIQPIAALTYQDLLDADALGLASHSALCYVMETTYACMMKWDGSAWTRCNANFSSFTPGCPMSITGGVLGVDTSGFATAAQGTKADNAAVGSTTTTALATKSPIVNYFSAAGSISPSIKRWVATVTPGTSTGLSIDISSASFSSILNAQAIAVRNTTTATSSPNVSIKSITNSALVVNITEGNAALVSLLGSSVLLGAATVFAATAGLTLYVCVDGL